jgi:MFS family permease
MLIHRQHSVWGAFPGQFWLIGFGVLVSSTGSSLVWPFQLIHISRILGLRLATVATLITLSSSMGFAISFLGGSLVDRLGRKPIMTAAQAAHGLGWILMSLAGTYLGFLAPMILMAVAQPFYAVGSDAMMADLLPPAQRSTGYSILRVFNNTGIALGPVLGGLLVTRSYPSAFRCAALAMLSYGVLLLLGVRETLPGRKTGLGPKKPAVEVPAPAQGYLPVLRDKGFLAFSAFMTLGMAASLMLWTLLSLYTKQNFRLSERLYGWLPVTNALMCVFAQYPVTRLTHRHQPLQTLVFGMLVYAAGVGSVAMMRRFWGFELSMIIFSLGELIVVPTATAYTANRAPQEARGCYMNIYWACCGLARGLAPLIGGYLNDQIHPAAIWYGGFLLALISAMGLLYMSKHQPAATFPEPAAS